MKRYLYLILLSFFLSVTPAPAQAGWCDWFSWWPGCSRSTSQLQITQQPQDKTVTVGDTASLAVKTLGGTGTIHYQWYENDVLIAGAIEDRYTILSAMLLQDGHWFTCKVTDNSGKWVSTDKATMTVLPSTTITPTATPTSTESPSPTWIPTPSPTETPSPTSTVTPSVTVTPTPSSTPTVTASPTPNSSPSSSPTVTPSVTPTASPTATATPSGTPITGGKIKYWTNEKGTALYVTPFYPSGYSATQHYTQVGVLHPGGYKAGSAGPAAVAIDLAAAGFVSYAVEYPLACLQNINGTWSGCDGSMPAQVATQDMGNYPEQTDAVAQFMKWCRKQSIHNGEVDLVGGSAGASHAAYMAATGTPGDTMPNKIVMCSIGVFYLADPNLLSLVCTENETCPVTATMNYVGASLEDQNNRNYTPYLPQLTAASPRIHAHYPGMSQMLLLTGSKDSTGIPTSDGYNIRSWDKTKNVAGVLENGSNGALPYLKSLGYQVVPWNAPQTPNTLSEMVVTTTDHAHAFEFWKQPDSDPAMVGRNVVIPWLKAPVVSSSPTPTPSSTPSVTPTPTSTPTATPSPSPIESPSPTQGGEAVVMPQGLYEIGGDPLHNPNIHGDRQTINWDAANPADGEYRWEVVDKAWTNAKAAGKGMGISVRILSSVPPWVKALPGIKIYNYTSKGEAMQIVLPSDPIAQPKILKFIAALCQHLNGVDYVIMGGLGVKTEMYMPLPADLGLTISNTDFMAQWVTACNKVVDTYNQNLTKTPFIAALGNPFDDPGAQSALDQVVNHGLLYRNFGLMQWGLNAGSNTGSHLNALIADNDVDKKDGHNRATGWQFTGSADGTLGANQCGKLLPPVCTPQNSFALTLAAAEKMGADFIEVNRVDGENPANAAVMAQYNKSLK